MIMLLRIDHSLCLRYDCDSQFQSFLLTHTLNFFAINVLSNVNIIAAKSISKIVPTSLGPKGMDKIFVSPDGDVVWFIFKICKIKAYYTIV